MYQLVLSFKVNFELMSIGDTIDVYLSCYSGESERGLQFPNGMRLIPYNKGKL